MDDPLAAWDIPRGLLYSDARVKTLIRAVMEAFNPKWFHRGALQPDPLRQAWTTRVESDSRNGARMRTNAAGEADAASGLPTNML
jgi:hypothetical protein